MLTTDLCRQMDSKQEKEIRVMVKAIVHEEINAVIRQAVKDGIEDALTGLGIAADDPKAAQADMHYLRNMRKGSEEMAGHVRKSVAWLLVMAMLTLVWMGLKGELKGL